MEVMGGPAEWKPGSHLSWALRVQSVRSVSTAVTIKYLSSWNSGPDLASYFISVLTFFHVNLTFEHHEHET